MNTSKQQNTYRQEETPSGVPIAAPGSFVRLALAAVLGYVLIIAAIGWFYPVAGDDFTFIAAVRSESAVSTIKYYFLNWGIRTGTIVSILLAHFDKTLFNLLNPLVQLLLLGLVFLMAAGRPYNRKSAADNLSLILLALLLLYGGARARDSIFWMTGAATYTWSMVLLLGFFIFFRLRSSMGGFPPRLDRILVVLLPLIGFFAGLGNENNAAGGMLVLLFFGIAEYRMKRRPPLWVWTGAVGFLAGAAMMAGAPGLRIRYLTEVAGNAAPSFADRMLMLPEIAAFWVFSSLPCLLLCGIFFGLWVRRDRDLFLARKWAVLLEDRRPAAAGLLVLLSLIMACAFAAGHPPAIRAYYSCFVLNAMAAVLMMRFILDRCRRLRTVLLLLAMLGGFTVLMIAPAIRDIGDIRRDQLERERLIAEQKSMRLTNLSVPPHSVRRRSLWHYIFIEDILEDAGFGLNRAAAKYYRVDSIRLSEKITPQTFWKRQAADD